MRGIILILSFLSLFVIISVCITQSPDLLSPIASFTELSTDEIAGIFLILMLILTVIFSYLLIRYILKSLNRIMQS